MDHWVTAMGCKMGYQNRISHMGRGYPVTAILVHLVTYFRF